MRIAITGLGTISSIGNNQETLLESLKEGRCGIAETSLFNPQEFRAKTSAEVKNYNPEDYFTIKQLVALDRFAQFAIISAREAVQDAKLTITPENAPRIAVIHSTGTVGGQTTQEHNYQRFYEQGIPRVHPMTVAKIMPSASASQISIELGAKGPVFGTASACASSAHAIAMGSLLLQSGLADVVIAGGAEATITPGFIRSWEAMRVVSQDFCRPFSQKRGGVVIGEGAGTLVLETLEHAEARNAPIHAECLGFGMSADATSILQPDVDGAMRSMQMALDQAKLQPDQIQYINAHGTGTAQNDPTETQAIRQVFGAAADNIAVSSTKSMLGHTLGAAGAVEAIATIQAIKHDFAPPTISFLAPDPLCDLDYVPNKARSLKIDYALSNSFGFGGLNVALVFGKHNA
ncbi:MAG: beta-ketoacyl-[acyl-carrier-protein] synthase family protein [Limnothrix sp. RL_2_0]|nr:beta-ketoacyl-[acyl-carrier-protein] synthase family protein [Limnothrix sp. RL_2_0]